MTIINNITTVILNPIIILLITIAFLMFIWGIVEFIAGAANEEKVKNGKRHMLWGIIGLFIMVGVFGIIQVIQNFINSL